MIRIHQFPCPEFLLVASAAIFFWSCPAMAFGASASEGPAIQQKKATPLPPRPKGRYESFKNSAISLHCPDGFRRAKSTEGLESSKSGASIYIKRSKQRYADVRFSMTTSNFERSGMRLIRVEDYEVPGVGMKGCLARVVKKERGVDVNQWLFFFGNNKETWTIAGSYLAATADKLRGPMKVAVLSARIDAEAAKRAPEDDGAPKKKGPRGAGRGSLSSLPPRPKGEYRIFAEAKIEVWKPTGFEIADTFAGLAHAASGSSVVIASLPAPYGELRKGLRPAAFARQGMTLKTLDDYDFGSELGACLAMVEQEAHGIAFKKWILYLGNAETTRLVTGNFPAASAKEMSSVIKSIVLSSRVKKGTAAGAVKSQLPYVTTAPEGMKLLREMNQMTMYVPVKKDTTDKKKGILFIVAPSVGTVDVSFPRSVALRRLLQTATFKDIKHLETKKRTVDAMEAYESEADAKDETTGDAFALYQMMVFGENRYYLLTAYCPAPLKEIWFSRFRAAARAFKLRRP